MHELRNSSRLLNFRYKIRLKIRRVRSNMNAKSMFDDKILKCVVTATQLPNIRSCTWNLTPLYNMFAQLLLGHPVHASATVKLTVSRKPETISSAGEKVDTFLPDGSRSTEHSPSTRTVLAYCVFISLLCIYQLILQSNTRIKFLCAS